LLKKIKIIYTIKEIKRDQKKPKCQEKSEDEWGKAVERKIGK
jgi:hypothetical protein